MLKPLTVLACLMVLGAAVPTLVAGLPAPAPGTPVARQTAPVPSDSALVTALRGGGHVIVCRHGATDHSATDRGPDRASQRNLTAEGERQARAIGEAIRRLGIPVGEARANPMYRNRETAEYAFGRMRVDSTLAGPNAWAVLHEMFAGPVPPGTNRAAVTRIGILTRAFQGHGVGRIEEGDCVIVRPGDGGGFTVVAHLTPGDWTRLAGLDVRGAARLESVTGPRTGARRAVEAVRLTGPAPAIDGRLNDPAWRAATVATGFVQRQPDAGEPASERTEVRVLYDDDALYVGIRLHDASPDSVVGRLARRDANVYSDWFFVGIDSYRDRRTAFVFGVNPRGVQRDFVIHDDRRTDASWDAVWESAAAVDAEGWTAEFRIPFSQLRFSAAGGGLDWGINFERRIARRDEVAYWAPVPGDAAGLVSLYGELRGLDGIASPRRLEVRPYTLGRLDREPGSPADPFHRPNALFGAAGADIRYGVTSDLTLSLTLNPDFGQVEADPSVLNLSAFETFFQERRPFFLEGAEIFDAGWPSLFYSRRIGRRPQATLPGGAVHADVPESTTILGAAKLTGKTASGWSVGALNAVTAEERARFVDGDGGHGRATVEPLANYAVARIQRDLRGGESAVGTILTATHRRLGASVAGDDAASGSGTGGASPGLALLHGAAYAAGVDARHRFGGGSYELNGALLASHVAGGEAAIARTQRAAGRYFQRPDAGHVSYDPERTSLSGYGARAMAAKVGGGHWRWLAAAQAFSPGFEINDLGFFLWPDEIFARASVGYDRFQPGRVFRNWRVDAGFVDERTFGGERTDAALDAFGRFTLQNHWGGFAHYMRHPETLSVDLLRGGPALYRPGRHMGGFNLHTDRRRAASGQASVNWDVADQGGGRMLAGSVGVDARPSPRMDLSLAPRVTVTHDPWQYVATRAASDSTYYLTAELRRLTAALTTRLNYTFSPTLSLQFYAQPFISAGEYSAFAAVADPRAPELGRRFHRFTDGEIRYDADRARYDVEPYAAGGAAFAFANPDFNFKQLRSNLVLRWEYRPGSTLFLVWGADRTGFDRDGSFRLRRDADALFNAPAANTLLLKVDYWLGR